jgi:hypothetical protein
MPGDATDSFFEDSPNSVNFGGGAIYDLSDEVRRIAGRIDAIRASYPSPDPTDEGLFAEYERDIDLLRNNQRSLSAIAELLEIMSDEWHSRWTM